jgi:hypothetical protein
LVFNKRSRYHSDYETAGPCAFFAFTDWGKGVARSVANLSRIDHKKSRDDDGRLGSADRLRCQRVSDSDFNPISTSSYRCIDAVKAGLDEVYDRWK